MAKLRFAILCLASSVDYRDNSLSLFKVMEALETPGLPAFIDSLEHVTLWERERDDVEQVAIRILIFDPDGRQLRPPDEVTLTMEKPRHRYLSRYRGMRLDKEGDYSFVTRMRTSSGRWKRVSTVSLEVKVNPDVGKA